MTCGSSTSPGCIEALPGAQRPGAGGASAVFRLLQAGLKGDGSGSRLMRTLGSDDMVGLQCCCKTIGRLKLVAICNQHQPG